jgi:hypothetical protein
MASPVVVAELEQEFWKPLPGEARHRMIARRWELYSLVLRWREGAKIVPGEELKPLRPWEDGIWEFRTTRPSPGSRLLGVILERNVFVALGLHSRDRLGKGRSQAWNDACDGARREYERIFAHRAPLRFRGGDFGEAEAKAFWNDK